MTRLYLVDDHLIMREGLRALLESGGHAVVGESADPTESLAELQRRQLPTKCVVLTSSAQPRHVAEALHMGARGYMLKESTGKDLMSAIEAVVKGRRRQRPVQ